MQESESLKELTNVSPLSPYRNTFNSTQTTNESLNFSSDYYFTPSFSGMFCAPYWTVTTSAFITREAILLLSRDSTLLSSIAHVTDTIENFLTERNIEAFQSISIGTDPEMPEWNALVLQYDLKNTDYSTLLLLWDDVCKKVYEELDPEVARKIAISFDQAE